MDSSCTDDIGMPDEREVHTVRQELRRVEDRLEKRIDRMDAESQAWRTRIEANSDNRHRDNIERFEKLETAINQGVGAMVALRAGWAFLIGLAGVVVGYFGHRAGN